MKRKFWQFIHDKLEDAWHWVYYHKLAKPITIQDAGNRLYSVRYVSKDGSEIKP